MAFTHLYVHSQYTLLNGVPTPKELVAVARANGMEHLALTDASNLYGAVEFYKACKEAKIHPVFGAELWVDPRGIRTREGKLDQAFQIVVLVEDEIGYRNLCALITRAIFDGLYYRPRIDWSLLASHAGGLLCHTGGELGPIRTDRGEENEARMTRLGEIFGADRLAVALQDIGAEGSDAWLVEARRVATRLAVPTLIVNDVRYVEPADAVCLDVLNCVAAGASLNDTRRPRPQTDQLYLKSEAELRELFPDDNAAMERTHEWAQRCHYKFPGGVYYFPASTPPDPDPPRAAADAPAGDGGDRPPPPAVDTDRNWAFFFHAFPPPRDFFPEWSDGLPLPARPAGAGSLAGYFSWYARRGLELRLEQIPEERHPAYWERLEGELTMIQKMGFAAYLLIVAEFINWAKDRQIPVGPGRGSAAGSLVTYAMRITDIDPVRYVLLFERFLNPERISMPDIDVDFAQDRREEVIEHVRDKYNPAPAEGGDSSERKSIQSYVSQIITYGKLQTKAALKDVARVCDLSFQESDRITKLVPNKLNISIQESLETEPKLRDLAAGDPKVQRVVALAKGIEGITRQTGVHAAGVVVADRPLVELAPLYRDGPEGGPVVQYDMKSAESIGLIKFDFLGLKTLDQIRDAVTMVARNTGERIDIDRIPVDDGATWKLLQKGDGLGVFQVESSGMRELLTRLLPNCIDDLIALVALYRPGPLSSGMVDDFIERKHGRKPVTYTFPELKDILGTTYGTIVYQEQVMQVAQVLGGYSLGEADLLRRAMGKKDLNEMARQKGRFVSGSVARGYDQQKIEDLFDLLAKFAEYGFNKSHSAAYGYIAYQTAWLKAHHRAEYMAALMTIDAGDSDKILVYINDCRRAGLKILPPDVQVSESAFNVPRDDRRAIRYGLSAIKGLGEGAITLVLAAREKAGGRFSGFFDFLTRVDPKKVNKKALESLIKSGALDGLGEPRARMLGALESAMDAAHAEIERRASSQVGLFAGTAAAPVFKLGTTPEWPIGERMRFEKEALGLFITGHPMSGFTEEVQRWATASLDQADRLDDKSEVRLAGMIAGMRVIRTKRGDKMAFVTIEDAGGSVECVFFADALAKNQQMLSGDRPVMISGKVERRDGQLSLRAETAERLEDLRERRTRQVEVEVPVEELDRDALASVQALFAANKGTCETLLKVRSPGEWTALLRIGDAWRVAATPRLVDGLRGMFGAEAVRLS